MKTAIVIGATGLIGQSLVQQLAESDHIRVVKAINRRPVEYAHPKVDNIIIDYARLSDYQEAFVGDLFFSCLGTTLKLAGSLQAQRRVDLEYQFEAAQAALHSGVSDYYLVSSSGAREDSKSSYLRMKGELEERIKCLAFNSITIFQPSLLLGERNHLRIGEKIASIVMPLLGSIPVVKKYRPILGSQVASKMVEASQLELKGVTYYTLDEIF